MGGLPNLTKTSDVLNSGVLGTDQFANEHLSMSLHQYSDGVSDSDCDTDSDFKLRISHKRLKTDTLLETSDSDSDTVIVIVILIQISSFGYLTNVKKQIHYLKQLEQIRGNKKLLI